MDLKRGLSVCGAFIFGSVVFGTVVFGGVVFSSVVFGSVLDIFSIRTYVRTERAALSANLSHPSL